jgi:hypothetical protein
MALAKPIINGHIQEPRPIFVPPTDFNPPIDDGLHKMIIHAIHNLIDEISKSKELTASEREDQLKTAESLMEIVLNNSSVGIANLRDTVMAVKFQWVVFADQPDTLVKTLLVNPTILRSLVEHSAPNEIMIRNVLFMKEGRTLREVKENENFYRESHQKLQEWIRRRIDYNDSSWVFLTKTLAFSLIRREADGYQEALQKLRFYGIKSSGNLKRAQASFHDPALLTLTERLINLFESVDKLTGEDYNVALASNILETEIKGIYPDLYKSIKTLMRTEGSKFLAHQQMENNLGVRFLTSTPKSLQAAS